MKLGLVVFALLAACGGGQHTMAGAPATENFASAFVHASQTGDVAAIRHMLGRSVLVAGIWFPDPVCTGKFAAVGQVTGARLDELARCLAGLKLQVSAHEEELVDVVALTYDPGFEIEARFLDMKDGPWLVSIGYEGRRDRADALPTVAPEALEALRVAGTAAPEVAGLDADIAAMPFHHAYAWLKVCIDTEGNVTGAHVRQATSPHAGRAFAAAIQDWKFRPFALNGHPLPVCSLELLAVPADVDRTKIAIPEPIVEPAGAMILASQALHRTAGDTQIKPTDHLKTAMQRSQIAGLIGSFQYCLAPTGKVESVDAVRSTGLPEYDEALMTAIRSWQYDPYLDDGKPVAVCSAVRFNYSQR